MKLRWSLIALVVAPVAAFSDEMPSSAESQSLIRKIVAITDESDLTNTARIRRILGIGSLLNTSEWERRAVAYNDTITYTLDWRPRADSSGIDAIIFTYEGSDKSKAVKKVELQLSGNPCVTSDDLQTSLKATPEYRETAGYAEVWAPNPPRIQYLERLRLTNKLGREIVLDDFLARTKACLWRFRILTHDGPVFADKPPKS